MVAKMMANRVFFYFDLQFRPQITRILQKTPEFRKMATMISWSEIILVFFGVKQRIGKYKRREKEGWITLRRAVMRCAVLCCG